MQNDRLDLADDAVMHDLLVLVVRPDDLPHLAAVVFVDSLLPVFRWLVCFCNQDFLKRVHVLLEALWAGIGAARRPFLPDHFGDLPAQRFLLRCCQEALPDVFGFHHVLEKVFVRLHKGLSYHLPHVRPSGLLVRPFFRFNFCLAARNIARFWLKPHFL